MKKYLLLTISFFIYFNLAAQKKKTGQKSPSAYSTQIDKNLSDSSLLDLVQKQTFSYFWDFAHPVSGLARERSNSSFNYGSEVVTTGGTGFGVMALIVATERKWIKRCNH